MEITNSVSKFRKFYINLITDKIILKYYLEIVYQTQNVSWKITVTNLFPIFF